MVREEGDEAGDGDEAAGGASECERMVELTGVVLRQIERGWKIYSHFYGCWSKMRYYGSITITLDFCGEC